MKQCNFNHVCINEGEFVVKTSSAYLWNPSCAEFRDDVPDPYVYEGTWIPYSISNEARRRYRCMAPADDCTTFTSSDDPVTNPQNNVKEGDLWSVNTNTSYIRRYGEWVAASGYRLRNAVKHDNGDYYGVTPENGNTWAGSAAIDSNPFGYCPRFSI